MTRFASVLPAITIVVAASRTAHAEYPQVPPAVLVVQPADLDGIGVLAIARHADLFADTTYEHADGSDAVALAAGARIRVGMIGFLEGELPVGYGFQAGAPALGNVTVGGGLLPLDSHLVGLALRIAAPTSPALGNGMTTVAALATPRIADPELFLPHTTSAELVADWRWRGDASWVQAEVGVAGWWQPSPAKFLPVLRGTAAGGVHVEPWLDLTASFVTRSFVLASDQPENFVHSLMLGLIGRGPRGQVTIRLEVPVDDRARNANRFVVGVELRGR
ncbi:MAG TPA: hypothetical protein VFQ65_27760 [Kofleriaceae bacterium]|nr:hypothetical protein [Kofleriaceae bacterium]